MEQLDQAQRVCTKCLQPKPTHEFQWRSKKNQIRKSECRACTKERDLDYHARNRGKIARARQRYGERNREMISQKHRAYYLTHRKTIIERVKKYAKERPGYRREVLRRWKEKNPERWREIARGVKQRAFQRDPTKVRDYKLKRQAIREARIRGAGEIEEIGIQELMERDGFLCGLCCSPVERRNASIDHILPVARGGSHTWRNVQLAHLRCNQVKGARWAGSANAVNAQKILRQQVTSGQPWNPEPKSPPNPSRTGSR